MTAGLSGYFSHAFGTDFSLPLPLWLFIYGGAAAVALSFVLTSLLHDGRPAVVAPARRRVWRLSRLVLYTGRAVALALLTLAILSGILGNQTPDQNFNVTFCWVIIFVGLTYLTVLFGNFWKLVNPFRLVADVSLHLGKRKPLWHYPRRLGHWPALVAYFVVICLELIFEKVATVPANLSALLLEYLIITLAGSAAFGVRDWFRYADFLSVYFRLAGRLAPLAYTANRIVVRKPLAGLLAGGVKDTGLLLFILFMLASTSFDGFAETKQYAWLREAAPGFIGGSPEIFGVLSLLMTLATFALLYAGCLGLIKLLITTSLSVRQMCYTFAYSLVPIAIGYSVAHYLTYLLLTGQNIIRLVSDPLGLDWNLFGTAGYQPNTTFLSPYATWYLQVAAIIIGHVAAIHVAHQIASRLFKPQAQRMTVLGQLPMLALMVAYTTASLWIIAQPVYIVQQRAETQRQKQQQFLERLRIPPPPMP